jgi:hypothetical protein
VTQSFSLARKLLPLGLHLLGGLRAPLGVPKGAGRLLLQPGDLRRGLLLHLSGLGPVALMGLVLARPDNKHEGRAG